MNLSYEETSKDLSTRINVHKKFSQLEINDWIISIGNIKPGEKVLDIGCGDGKQVEMLARAVGENGEVYGADINESLLEMARDRIKKCGLKASFTIQDLDQKFEWEDARFDLVTCCFAIYYAVSAEKTLLEIKRVIKNGGRMFICGPTENNAAELNSIHEEITGQKIPQTAVIRAARIKNEFLPLIRQNFNDVKVDIFKNKISFPSAQSFMDYYSATLLFKEGVPDQRKNEVLSRMRIRIEEIVTLEGSFAVSKEVIGISARK
ncbi:MAG: class I SAM-dependent methyltransferase [Minisyncoccales bacterium]